jgi:plasmid stabilization system protein ParE
VDYRIVFAQRALTDFAEIIGYIAEDDDEAAARFGGSLLDHVELLARYPRMGGVIRKRSRVRKLLHSPILVYYQIREDRRIIEVLHCRHGSRNLPKF